MHLITAHFGQQQTRFLLFKDGEQAKTVHEAAVKFWEASEKDGLLKITDDFEQMLCVACNSLHALHVEDLDRTQAMTIDIAVHQMRTQAKAQQVASSDPILRTSAMMRGPMVIDPTQMNGGQGRPY